jgi:hypothetical protein
MLVTRTFSAQLFDTETDQLIHQGTLEVSFVAPAIPGRVTQYNFVFTTEDEVSGAYTKVRMLKLNNGYQGRVWLSLMSDTGNCTQFDVFLDDQSWQSFSWFRDE